MQEPISALSVPAHRAFRCGEDHCVAVQTSACMAWLWLVPLFSGHAIACDGVKNRSAMAIVHSVNRRMMSTRTFQSHRLRR
jgi:hypothetical protein